MNSIFQGNSSTVVASHLSYTTENPFLMGYSEVMPLKKTLYFFIFVDYDEHEYKQYGPGRYPFEVISQYAGSTKRYIDDIITVSLGHTIGPTLQDIILQDDVFFGMYPTTVREFDGSVRPSPIISIVREQIGPSVHFLDMEVIQPLPGVCEVKIYDKRDNMPIIPWLRIESSLIRDDYIG